MISVSIIMSTYNRPSALIAALTALGRQTRRDFEIVVPFSFPRSDLIDDLLIFGIEEHLISDRRSDG